MTVKIVVGPSIEKGLRNDRLSFAIDNDSFPALINAYQWRGRVKRKRGTSLLCRLQRFFNSLSTSYSPAANSTIPIAADGSGNLLTGFVLQTNGNIIPGSVVITGPGAVVYTDPAMDGILSPSGTINYSTGAIVLAALAGVASAQFLYYPDLPVMGLEKFVLDSNHYADTIAFDTKYSYNIPRTLPHNPWDVSFYKNPVASASLPGYAAKTDLTPTTWNGEDYQQFWTVSYQGALWATNGMTVPFISNRISMQFAPASTITYVSNTATTLTVNITNTPLVIGDFVFVNEWGHATPASANSLNWQTGYVTAAAPNTPAPANKTITITFPFANIAIVGAYTPGIIQYLTNRSDTTKDVLRWYDGDPTNGSATNPVLNGPNGWVNFSPPLSQNAFSIGDAPAAIYYLVGAKIIFNYKDYLLFLGAVVQTSTGAPIYLADTVVFSQIGNPYYTASFQGDPRFPTSIISVLVPVNHTAFPAAYFEDSIGFGGSVTAGLDEQILTAGTNEDAIIIGLNTNQTRLMFTGNEIVPFEFFLISSELGSSSTFSVINMDRGVITRGSRGYIITGQTECVRIDNQIPDQVFESTLTNNGSERITAARDFLSEWVYFTYLNNSEEAEKYFFPNQTLFYNYRDNSWAIFNETYTHYGIFNKETGFTWATVGTIYETWNAWNDPWKAGASTLLQPQTIAGNQQGFVLVREEENTNEATSLYIRSFSSSTVTSADHSLDEGDFIVISGAIGTISTEVNNKIFSVSQVNRNTFVLNPTIGTGTYSGGGLITRLYVPFIQTKQFPIAWEDARKTRLGSQRYLFSTTDSAQIQLLIYLSQNDSSPYNTGALVPALNTTNSSLIYSTTLYTCPESTNLGLTPANTNLMTPTAAQQSQLWHRKNTSLIGDTVQIGFTISKDQMRALKPDIPVAITDITQANPAVITTTANFPADTLVLITGVQGMVELNGNRYTVTSSTATETTINVDTTGYNAYTENGTLASLGMDNQIAEVELCSFILEASPSSMLV